MANCNEGLHKARAKPSPDSPEWVAFGETLAPALLTYLSFFFFLPNTFLLDLCSPLFNLPIAQEQGPPDWNHSGFRLLQSWQGVSSRSFVCLCPAQAVFDLPRIRSDTISSSDASHV